MSIRTTTIGAYPKPEYVPIPDWFREESTVAKDPTIALDNCVECHGPQAEELLDRATREVVLEQVRLGIDVPATERFAAKTTSITTAGIWRESILPP